MSIFTQVRAFDTSKGGTIPNLCLDNVRKGYGISNKYSSAWIAWQHTQQHADRNIPTGLDIPLYYSYTTTIDGVSQNYGHINVRLADGRVWSDGNYYASVADYESKKYPRFVGWGESVNDYQIIKQESEDMPVFNEGDRVNMNISLYGKDSGGHQDAVGKPYKEAVELILSSRMWKDESRINEGDRHNLNVMLYDNDGGGHKDAIGKIWKDGIGAILNSQMWKDESHVNGGDVSNFNSTKDGLGDSMKGKLWKKASYDNLRPSIGGGTSATTVLKKGDYRVE